MTTKSYITFWGKILDNVEYVFWVFFSLSNKFSIVIPQEVDRKKCLRWKEEEGAEHAWVGVGSEALGQGEGCSLWWWQRERWVCFAAELEHSQGLHVPGISPAWVSFTPLSNSVATAFCFTTEQVSCKIHEGRDFYTFSSKLYLWK